MCPSQMAAAMRAATLPHPGRHLTREEPAQPERQQPLLRGVPAGRLALPVGGASAACRLLLLLLRLLLLPLLVLLALPLQGLQGCRLGVPLLLLPHLHQGEPAPVAAPPGVAARLKRRGAPKLALLHAPPPLPGLQAQPGQAAHGHALHCLVQSHLLIAPQGDKPPVAAGVGDEASSGGNDAAHPPDCRLRASSARTRSQGPT